MDINNPKTRKDWFGVLVAGILFGFFILLVQGAYRSYEKTFPPPDATSMIASKEEWITYTNTNYGYQIVYPPQISFTPSSKLARQPAPKGKEDQIVLLEDLAYERIYTIVAGQVKEYTASSSAELKQKYEEIVVQQSIEWGMMNGFNLTPADFRVKEVTFAGRPAIEVINPLRYSIQSFNTTGVVFDVTARYYTGGTTTPKEQLTREIMETFRVLD
jgi:hypothetical protein